MRRDAYEQVVRDPDRPGPRGPAGRATLPDMSTASDRGARPAAPRPAVAYRRLSVSQRRSQLLAAALGLFAHRAPEDVSLDDVAAAAEVSRPLVYRYFPGGKQQLYEAALRSAADELELCFRQPQQGPLTQRLTRALDSYLGFVDEHDAGFKALLQGGSVVQTSQTTAIVDEVRRSAAEQILLHIEVPEPGHRLLTMIRTWITAVEGASLIWLDEGKQPPLPELRGWLVDHFIALLVATAAGDEECGRVLRRALELETADGPAGDLVRRIAPFLPDAAHLLGEG
ncbi:TetR/AcrR family transcriptional regulator [Streptomyces sp. MAR4 CNY-716]